MGIRVVIIDDLPLARERVRAMLGSESDVEVVGEAHTGAGAVKAVRSIHPDILFLDIQLPDMDGFEVVRQIGPDYDAVTVFVTAYVEHAVRAFRVHAIDYVVKPFDEKRLMEAFHAARRTVEDRKVADHARRLRQLLQERGPAENRWDRLLVETGGRSFPVKVEDIDWIEAQGNYCVLHVRGRSLMLRTRISELERKVGTDRFVRIHRSTMINLDRVKELAPLFHGDYEVTLADGCRLTLSRSHRANLMERLGMCH